MVSRAGYLRSPVFDFFFVLFTPALAIFSAFYVVINPEQFHFVLTLDLALLGYHHVISTYTRIACSKDILVANRYLVVYLPPVILFVVIGLALLGSAWLVTTIYLHWQWWHYTRQSEGISKSILIKTGGPHSVVDRLDRAVFYLVPTACFILMSSRLPETFLFMKVVVMPVPILAAECLGYVTLAIWLFWFAREVSRLVSKQIALSYFLYGVSHHLIYLISYVLIVDVTFGWLAINIWHNMQYILFVWHANANTYRGGVVRGKFAISWLSQPERFFIYMGVCLIITQVFYKFVDMGVSLITPYTALPVILIAYMSINFHHYIVDTLIWKIRRSAVRRALGVSC